MLFVGLGNPGQQYDGSPHNVGFAVVDELAARLGCHWRDEYRGQYGEGSFEGTRQRVLKPLTFMNESGRSVDAAMKGNALGLEELLVVHDDIDLDFGRLKLQRGGGDAGHNGLRSVTRECGDSGYLRLRVGVGRPVGGSVVDYVLKPFSSERLAAILPRITAAVDGLCCLLRQGEAPAMAAINRRHDMGQGACGASSEAHRRLPTSDRSAAALAEASSSASSTPEQGSEGARTAGKPSGGGNESRGP